MNILANFESSYFRNTYVRNTRGPVIRIFVYNILTTNLKELRAVFKRYGRKHLAIREGRLMFFTRQYLGTNPNIMDTPH